MGTGGNNVPVIITPEYYWRKLTPIECERLQTLPDNYTACVSNSRRYKAIGNGWTVATIQHIFSYLP
jgi:site-specific DNA-cytosine methylase